MQMLIFTGPSGITALAATATAAVAAGHGIRVLLTSVGPSHPLATLVGIPIGGKPQPVGPGLDAWCLNPLEDLTRIWSTLPHKTPITADELPLIPGADLFLAVANLRAMAGNYDLICVDAGPPDMLLRALGVPDSFRWTVRLFLGLDRGPGRSSASVSRALVPVGMLPFPLEWTSNLQEARVRLEQLRDETVAPSRARVRYVLRADRAGLEESRVTLPALQLFGLAVEAIIVGPLLPYTDGLTPIVREQEQVIDAVARIWPGHPLLRLPVTATPGSLADLTGLGARIYDRMSPLPEIPLLPPVRVSGPPEPSVAMDVPGLPRESLGLTLSGDELIVRAGIYRRHLLLPDGLRGTTAIKASRQGETLIVRPKW